MKENGGKWRRMEAKLLQRGLPERCNITTKRREHHRVMLWTTGDVMSPQVITAVLAQQVKTWLRIYAPATAPSNSSTYVGRKFGSLLV